MRPLAAFIRAIGPETHRVMQQSELCAACEKLGLRDVKSYIASGNLYFKSAKSLTECSRLVSKAISTFGLERPVFTRSAVDLDAVIAANPYPQAASERPSLLSVSLFDDDFDQALLGELLKWPGPEKLVARTRMIFVDYVSGQGTSKISPPVIERKLKCVGTARNWNTILKMRKLLEAMED